MPQNKDNIPTKAGKRSARSKKRTSRGKSRRAIDRLFGSGSRIDVLWTMMKHAGHGLLLPEIIDLSGRSSKDVKRALEILASMGLVERYTIDSKATGTRHAARYALSKDHPLAGPLRKILECSLPQGSIYRLREALKEIPGIDVAFVFGSFAESTQQTGSDIDVMIVGRQDRNAIDAKIPDLERAIGREVQAISYTPGEWRKAYEKRDHFVVSMMETEKIFIFGNAGVLERITLGDER